MGRNNPAIPPLREPAGGVGRDVGKRGAIIRPFLPSGSNQRLFHLLTAKRLNSIAQGRISAPWVGSQRRALKTLKAFHSGRCTSCGRVMQSNL